MYVYALHIINLSAPLPKGLHVGEFSKKMNCLSYDTFVKNKSYFSVIKKKKGKITKLGNLVFIQFLKRKENAGQSWQLATVHCTMYHAYNVSFKPLVNSHLPNDLWNQQSQVQSLNLSDKRLSIKLCVHIQTNSSNSIFEAGQSFRPIMLSEVYNLDTHVAL